MHTGYVLCHNHPTTVHCDLSPARQPLLQRELSPRARPIDEALAAVVGLGDDGGQNLEEDPL
jgi:hypothetical protein